MLIINQQMSKPGKYANHDTGEELGVDQVGEFLQLSRRIPPREKHAEQSLPDDQRQYSGKE